MKLSELAAEAAGFFTRGEREAPGIGKILTHRGDPERPAWFRNLCHAAHDAGGMMPDDWRYEFIGDALDSLSELEDDEDDDEARERFEEWFDGAYVYTHQQTAWLASRADRMGYCDDFAKEYGDAGTETWRRIAGGMLFEAREVFESVLSSLRTELEAREDAAEESAAADE